jgi:hypothetical protein
MMKTTAVLTSLIGETSGRSTAVHVFSASCDDVVVVMRNFAALLKNATVW